MIERAVQFGPDNGLCGILCEPDPKLRIPSAPPLLLWNVGVNHRVGPYRIYVELARRLAAAGYSSLRFDASGLGDSAPRKDSSEERGRAALDVKEAMSLLERRLGARRFVLVGFCSSVDAAHALAVTDERVAGLIALEGYSWPTRGYWLRYPLRFLQPARWRRLARHLLARFFGGLAPAEGREQVFLRDYPTPDRFRREVRLMASRGTRMLFLYVGGDTDYNHREQLFELLGGRELEDKLELEFYPEADHTFFRVEHRERAMARICGWMQCAFPARREARPEISEAL